MFYASNNFNCDGSKRDKLCSTRVRVSYQALAAILNDALENGASLPDGYSPTVITAILMGDDRGAISAMGTTLGDWNRSGEGVDVIDSDFAGSWSSDPDLTQSVADPSVVDCP